jgi:hypothetical protein
VANFPARSGIFFGLHASNRRQRQWTLDSLQTPSDRPGCRGTDAVALLPTGRSLADGFVKPITAPPSRRSTTDRRDGPGSGMTNPIRFRRHVTRCTAGLPRPARSGYVPCRRPHRWLCNARNPQGRSPRGLPGVWFHYWVLDSGSRRRFRQAMVSFLRPRLLPSSGKRCHEQGLTLR